MAELEVVDGEAAAGRPAGGSKTLVVVEMGRATSWRPGDVKLWPRVRRGGASVGRGPAGGGGMVWGKNWVA